MRATISKWVRILRQERKGCNMGKGSSMRKGGNIGWLWKERLVWGVWSMRHMQ